MSGIGGFFHPAKDYMEHREYCEGLLDRFRRTLKHRGPDDSGTFLSSHCGLARTWLAVSDTKNGHEPVQLDRDGRRMTLVHDGEIYNKNWAGSWQRTALPGFPSILFPAKARSS